MKIDPVQKMYFSLSLIGDCCDEIKKEKSFFMGEGTSKDELQLDIEAWIKKMNEAIILLRQTGRLLNTSMLKWSKDLRAKIFETKAKIHHTIGLIEYRIELSSKDGEDASLGKLEHLEVSLMSALECLAIHVKIPSETKISLPVKSVQAKKHLADREKSFERMQKDQKCLRQSKSPTGVLWDLLIAEKTIFSSIPYDCYLMFKRSPLTCLVLVLMFPITVFIYLIVGVHECLQRRNLRKLYFFQKTLHKKIKSFRDGSVSYPTQEVDDFLQILAPLGGRSYDFHLTPALRGTSWNTIGEALADAEQFIASSEGNVSFIYEELLESFSDLRIEVQQIYAGTFEDLESELKGAKTTLEKCIKRREELVGSHIKLFERALSSYCKHVERLEMDVKDQESKRVLAKFEEVRFQLLLSALERAIELGLVEHGKALNLSQLKAILNKLELLAVIEELKSPILTCENVPSDPGHTEMLVKFEKARTRYFQLSEGELEDFLSKTLNSHYVVSRNTPNHLVVLKLSERRVPLLSRMLFQKPPFDYDKFLKSNAVKWMFEG